MSSSTAIIIALLVGLVCGYMASESSYFPTERMMSRYWRTWYSAKEAITTIISRPKSTRDTIKMLSYLLESTRKSHKVSQWDLLVETSIRFGAAERCYDHLLKAGIIVEEPTESSLPDEIFVTLAIEKKTAE